jgi:hypothetical protein
MNQLETMASALSGATLNRMKCANLFQEAAEALVPMVARHSNQNQQEKPIEVPVIHPPHEEGLEQKIANLKATMMGGAVGAGMGVANSTLFPSVTNGPERTDGERVRDQVLGGSIGAVGGGMVGPMFASGVHHKAVALEEMKGELGQVANRLHGAVGAFMKAASLRDTLDMIETSARKTHSLEAIVDTVSNVAAHFHRPPAAIPFDKGPYIAGGVTLAGGLAGVAAGQLMDAKEAFLKSAAIFPWAHDDLPYDPELHAKILKSKGTYNRSRLRYQSTFRKLPDEAQVEVLKNFDAYQKSIQSAVLSGSYAGPF